MDITRHPARPALAGGVLIVLAAIGFSAKAVLIKLAYAETPEPDAITLLTLRMLLALPFFVVVAFRARIRDEGVQAARDWGAVALLGVMGYYLASYLDFAGLQYVSAGMERMILFLYPTFVVLFTALLYRRPVGSEQIGALLLGYSGIALVYGGTSQALSPTTVFGALLILGSAVVFALFMTGSGHFIPRLGSTRFTAYAMTAACVATGIHFALSRPLERLLVSTEVLGLAFILALVSTVAPAFLMSAGIRRIGAGRAAVIGTVGPVATLILAYGLLGETLAPTQMVGSALVLAGVLLVALRRGSR